MPEMVALSPTVPPASTVLRIKILPSREVVERLTLPAQTMNSPRGAWPSTNRIAPDGSVLLWLIASSERSAGAETAQKYAGFRWPHSVQLSTISRPYGAFISLSGCDVHFLKQLKVAGVLIPAPFR